MKIGVRLACLCCLVGPIGLFSPSASGQFQRVLDIEQPPFLYSQTQPENRVSRLLEALRSQKLELEYTHQQGNLESLLVALEIPVTSQVLVFSKTSLQVRYISSRNPRAIYFNDDTYLGWVYGSSLVEISTADPKLGTAFYTIDMSPTHPKLQQAYYDCMACHATSLTQGIPGHTVRSVIPTYDGTVDPRRESFITDDRSPLKERWGGWYVTGLHGEMVHMGNTILSNDRFDITNNGNRKHLRDEFDTSHYLSPYSDIVALMVLEHQTQMHNSLIRADFFVRQLQYETRTDEPTVEFKAERQQQLRLIAKEVVDRMLFRHAAPLTSQVSGSVKFAEQFASRGPKDAQGRSLRDFDLETRLFRYPCSFLIYSTTFDALQSELRDEIYRQLKQVLSPKDSSGPPLADDYPHLSPEMRADILEILAHTKTGWPN